MRKALQTATVTYLRRSPSFGRRPVGPIAHDLTCLSLCVHHETEKALLVSDCADLARAVWCPKALVTLDPNFCGEFIVATMSKRLAEQKGLWPRAIHVLGWAESRVIALADAERAAARKRSQLRGHQGPLGYTRNVFA
jgi:hypothetical protein